MKVINAFKNLFDAIDNAPIKSTFAKVLIFLLILALATGVVFFVWWLEQLLWNASLAEYFGWEPISFWQMAWLSILAGWLFKSNNTNKDE